MEQRVHVLIADDVVRTRQGLQALLAVWPEIEVMGAAANGVEVIQLMEKYRPDVALMDILRARGGWTGSDPPHQEPVAAGQDCGADDVHGSWGCRVGRRS